MTITERNKLIRDIRDEAKLLGRYKAQVVDKDQNRQQCIDNDLQVILERLRELNANAGVDAAALNALRPTSRATSRPLPSSRASPPCPTCC